MILTEKKFLEQLKLVFTSLFLRKMTFVVFGCPLLQDNELIFSNINLEDMELYEPKTLYYMHKVTIKNKDFLIDLYEKFPILKSSVVLIDTRPFLAMLNKQKTLEDINIVELPDHTLNIQLKHGDLTPVIDDPIGQVISEYQSILYHDNFKSGLVDSDDPYQTIIDTDTLKELDICPVPTVDVYNHRLETVESLYRAKAPIQEGMSFPSKTEYLKRFKNDNVTISLKSGTNTKAIKLQFIFETPFVRVESVQPAARWFDCNSQ